MGSSREPISVAWTTSLSPFSIRAKNQEKEQNPEGKNPQRTFKMDRKEKGNWNGKEMREWKREKDEEEEEAAEEEGIFIVAAKGGATDWRQWH